jgi:hypothetical protein
MKAPLLLTTIVCGASLAFAFAGGACDEYEAPPRPVLLGLSSGVLTDPRAPLEIDFGTAIDPSTLVVKVALYDTDPEGNLKDEDEDPESELKVLLRRDPGEGDFGVTADIDAAAGRAILNAQAALPVGPKLVLIVEPGLTSASGRLSKYRVRIPFSFVVKCDSRGASTKFQNGVYFALLEVDQPLGTQIQLYGAMEVDPTTGALAGQFTNADRNAAQACPTPCGSADVCRLLPAPACVPQSTRAGTADEWPDFVPNNTPPTGYSFQVQGCAVDDGEAAGVLTAPATMAVEQPKVTVEGLTMTAQFGADPAGVVRATGSLTADTVRLGTNPLGAGKGSMTAVRIPDDKVPPHVPRPPRPSAPDGGTDAAK